MSKERVLIATINGTEIYAVNHEGETYVPIRPICTAIGVDIDSQRKKINEDDLTASTTVIITVVAADGKEREQLCLPLKYVYGWLATTNPTRDSDKLPPRVL